MPNTQHQINWQEAAQTLQQHIVGNVIESSVLEHLRQADHVLVACSGGADSVFLLCVLMASAKDIGLQLHVAHYNHRWRSEASDVDASFVESLAASFNLPFLSDARSEKEPAFTETTARKLRLNFLRKAAHLQHCDHIVFGHQLDDIIETQLQRIARGCATDGLAAPRPVAFFDKQPTHLRPLLHLRARDIRKALQASKIPWREDRSNENTNIARNSLRLQIIPDLGDALGRDPAVGAARSRLLLEEDAVALDLLARKFLPDAYAHAPTLDRARLNTVPTALLRRALAEWLSGHNLLSSLGAPAMDLLIESLHTEREHNRISAGKHYILIDGDTLSFEHQDASDQFVELLPAILGIGETLFLSTGAFIQTEALELTDTLRQQILGGSIDPLCEAIITYPEEDSLAVRAWQPGDRFHPLGATGGKKLKDCFIDRHIPKAERKTLPLVINASQVVIWIPGFPPAEGCKIGPSTKRALRLTYQTTKPLCPINVIRE
ncbi:MAG: tRNA lysidine(34) synthetase TilS [Verrucomicrobiota bacterium]|nr:tRNA lysidine(34) synthetase TilS [Verrucomicrobiota bacterium]